MSENFLTSFEMVRWKINKKMIDSAIFLMFWKLFLLVHYFDLNFWIRSTKIFYSEQMLNFCISPFPYFSSIKRKKLDQSKLTMIKQKNLFKFLLKRNFRFKSQNYSTEFKNLEKEHLSMERNQQKIVPEKYQVPL
jgi:hypothetical protein